MPFENIQFVFLEFYVLTINKNNLVIHLSSRVSGVLKVFQKILVIASTKITGIIHFFHCI